MAILNEFLKVNVSFSKDIDSGIEFLIADLVEIERVEIPGHFSIPISSSLKVKSFVFNSKSPVARRLLDSPKKVELNMNEFQKGFIDSSIVGKKEAYFHSDLKNVL